MNYVNVNFKLNSTPIIIVMESCLIVANIDSVLFE